MNRVAGAPAIANPVHAAAQGAEVIDHQDTVDWLAAHPEALSAYEDEWVAMVGDQVIAHSPSMSEAWRLAKERGYDDPLLVPVIPSDVILIV